MRKMKNCMKIGILTFGILLTLTNCEKDDYVVSLQQEAQINSKYKVPSISDTQSKFETLKAQNNLFNNSNDASSKGVSSKENSLNIYIDWEDSKSVNFNSQENINILYTPVLFNNSKRIKSFLASVEFEGNIETRALTLLYDDSSDDTQFSGYIFKHNLDGDLLNVYKYTNGIKQEYDFGSQEKTKSSKDALSGEAPNSDCDGASIEDLLWMLEVGYGINELECIEIAGSGGGGDTGSDTGSDTNWDNPYDYLNGLSTSGNFSTGGGSGSSGSGSGTSGTSNTGDSTSNDTWWEEEAPESTEANTLTNNLDGLNIPQVKWINNTNNLATVILLNNFLIANGNTSEAKNFAKEAIEALIRGDYVDFEEAYIETETPDDEYIYTGTKQLIPNPLTLSNGDQVSLQFGTTKSDNKNANQEVSIDLIAGIKDAIEQANFKLSASEKITSIYIMATTNGKHSPTSNHSNGTAIDISRINGIKMSLSGVTNQITELQKGFDGFIWIRENFGPAFKHKYYNSNGTWDLNYNIGGHKDHIHVSIRK